jgi:hypothetical protein
MALQPANVAFGDAVRHTSRDEKPPAEVPAQSPATPAPERSSPFEAVRWSDAGTPEVQVEGTWYVPMSINGVAVSEILDFCNKRYGDRARKRFEEDLVAALRAMEHPLPATVRLGLRTIGDGKELSIPNAAMTEANRSRIWQAAADREKHKAAGERPPLPAPQAHEGCLLAPEALAVCDRLVELLATQHAYSVARNVDPTKLLAETRKRFSEAPADGLPREMVVEHLQRAIASVGDGHAELDATHTPAPAFYLPATLVAVPAEGRGRVAALDPASRDLLDRDHPFVIAIDGAPMERWIETASGIVAKGSPQLIERRALRALSDLPAMRSRLGITLEPELDSAVSFTLGNAAGEQKTVATPVRTDQPNRPRHAPASPEPSPGVTYLRISSMTDDPQEVAAIRAACLGSGPGGLIIDLRGNGGGSRVLVQEIGRLLLRADAEPLVYNAARPLRLPGETPAELRERLDSRFLRPADDPRWTDAERAAIARFVSTFVPALALSNDRFHPWHFAVLTPAAANAQRIPGKVVVLLDAGCFSATDIFLCALKELDGVTLVGVPSSGGSGLTRRHDCGHGFTARLSTMVSFQPSGTLLDGHGVTPDEVVPPGVADFTSGTDAMLERAIELLSAAGRRVGPSVDAKP